MSHRVPLVVGVLLVLVSVPLPGAWAIALTLGGAVLVVSTFV